MRTICSSGHMSKRVKKYPGTIWILSVLFLFFFTARTFAAISTLPFPDLVGRADLILIAKVSDKVPIPKSEKGCRQLKNVLTIEKVLKGKRETSTPLELLTMDSSGKWVEDALAFPDKGTRVVLFLARGKDGSLSVVNGIQGVWPLKAGTDKTLGMGFRYSIKQLMEEIKLQGSASN